VNNLQRKNYVFEKVYSRAPDKRAIGNLHTQEYCGCISTPLQGLVTKELSTPNSRPNLLRGSIGKDLFRRTLEWARRMQEWYQFYLCEGSCAARVSADAASWKYSYKSNFREGALSVVVCDGWSGVWSNDHCELSECSLRTSNALRCGSTRFSEVRFSPFRHQQEKCAVYR